MTQRATSVFYGWVIVAACSFALSAQAFIFSFGIFYKPLMDQFGWKAADVALAPSILSLAYLTAVLPASWAYQKWGIKRVTLIGGILMGSGLAISSTTTTLWQLCLSYGVLAGIGSSAIWVSFTSTIMKWFLQKRGIAMGIAISGQGLGSFLVAPSFSYVIETTGWRTALLLAGLSIFLIVSSAALVTKGSPEEVGLRPYGRENGHGSRGSNEQQVAVLPEDSFQAATHRRQFWLLYSLWFLSQIVASIYTQHLVLFAVGLGISAILASIVLGSLGLSSIIGGLAVGFLLHRIGIRRALIYCYLLTLLSALVLLATKNALWLFLFAVLFGFSFGARTLLEVPIASSFFGLNHLGVMVGAFETAFGVGGFIGPYLGGYVYDLTGGYSEVFLFCIILSTLSFAIAIALKPSRTDI